MMQKIGLIVAVYTIARMIQIPFESLKDVPWEHMPFWMRLQRVVICSTSVVALLALIPLAVIVLLWELFW